MTRQLIGMGAALLLIGGAGGYWVHSLADDRAETTDGRARAEADANTGTPALIAVDRHAAATESASDEAASVAGARHAQNAESLAADATEAQGTQAAKSMAPLDFARFTEMLGSNRAMLARISVLESAENLSADERSQAVAITGEFMRLLVLAKAKSELPSSDVDVFPAYVVAFFDSALEPGPSARSELKSRVVLELATTFDSVDRMRTLPVKMQVLREQVTERVIAWIKDTSGKKRSAEVDELLMLQPTFMGGGDYGILDIGVGVEPPDREFPAVECVLELWTKAFGLTESQLPIAEAGAERIVESAMDALRSRNLDHVGAKLSDEVQLDIDKVMRSLQLEEEGRLTSLLTAKQFAAARAYGPVRIRVHWGEVTEIIEKFAGL